MGELNVEVRANARRVAQQIIGGVRQHEEQKDAARTVCVNQQDYRLIRFWNRQINTEMDDVLDAIYAALTDS